MYWEAITGVGHADDEKAAALRSSLPFPDKCRSAFRDPGLDVPLNTPADARQTWCNFTSTRLNQITNFNTGVERITGQNCLANLCQAWQWYDGNETQGYCGGNGIPYQVRGPQTEEGGFGQRDLLITDTRYLMWDGPTDLYPFQTTPQSLEIVSTDANDTALGTGAQQVFYRALTSTYDVLEGFVDMNGITPVPVPGGAVYLITTAIRVLTAGANNANVGDIDIRVAGGGAVLDRMPAGISFAPTALVTVPNNFTGVLLNWEVSMVEAGGTQGEVTGYLSVRQPNGTVFSVDVSPVLRQAGQSVYQSELPRFPLSVGTSAYVTAEAAGATDTTARGKLTMELRPA